MSVEKEAAERKFRDEEWQQWRDKWYNERLEMRHTQTLADYVDHLMEGIRRAQ